MDLTQLKQQYRGVQVVMATPFKSNFELDETGLRSNSRYLLDAGVHVLTPLGTTGEFFSMSVEEQKRVMKVVVDEIQGSDLIVIPGASAISTMVSVELSQYAQSIGAHAVMVAPPFYMPATPQQVVRHYERLSREIDIGIVIYYLPQLHRATWPFDTWVELSELKNVIGIKWCELDLHPFTSVIRRLSGKLSFMAGYAEYLAPYSYLVGARGISSPMSNYAPHLSVKLHQAATNKDWDLVKEIAFKTFALYDFDVKVGAGLALVKEAMAMVGRPAGPLRPPLSSTITEEQRKELKQILMELGILK